MQEKELKEFLSCMHACEEQCKIMLECEQAKRKALISGKEQELENVVQRQQAEIMKLQSLESQRLEQQAKMGMEGLSASQMLKRIPEGRQKEELASCFDSLCKIAEELKFYNQKALEIAKANLQFINSTKEVRETQKGTYSPQNLSGKNTKKTSFEIKI